MKRANLRESSFCAGVRGAIVEGGTLWETREDIRAAARAKGTKEPTLFQLERWRRVKLLPPVKPHHGSIVEYPPGTARQAVRLIELLRDKETFEHVGWELWWEGFEVGNHYWEPRLQEAAATGDLGIGMLKPLLALWRSSGGDEDETAFDKLQQQIPARVLAPQITRRLSAVEMAVFLRILAHVGGGKFSIFDDVQHPDSLSEYEIAVSGLDIQNAGNYEKGPPGKSKPKPDRVFGKDMNFIQVLPNVFRAMARTLRRNTLSDALKLLRKNCWPHATTYAAPSGSLGIFTKRQNGYTATGPLVCGSRLGCPARQRRREPWRCWASPFSSDQVTPCYRLIRLQHWPVKRLQQSKTF